MLMDRHMQSQGAMATTRMSWHCIVAQVFRVETRLTVFSALSSASLQELNTLVAESSELCTELVCIGARAQLRAARRQGLQVKNLGIAGLLNLMPASATSDLPDRHILAAAV